MEKKRVGEHFWNTRGTLAPMEQDRVRAVRRVPILLIVGMLFLGDVLGVQASEEDIEFPFNGIISANNVNIRVGASPNFEILCQLNKMDKVVVQGITYQWYKVKLPKQARCFISKDYVYQGIVYADNVNIRAGRGTNYNVLGQLNSGDLVTILEEYESWLRIEPPEDFIGWVHSDFVEYYSSGELTQEERMEEAVEEAEEIEEAKEEVEPPPIASGIIEDLGVIINRPGKQKLIGNDGRIFYLKSESVDLAKYVYYRVRVWGSMWELPELKYPLIVVEKIELIE